MNAATATSSSQFFDRQSFSVETIDEVHQLLTFLLGERKKACRVLLPFLVATNWLQNA